MAAEVPVTTRAVVAASGAGVVTATIGVVAGWWAGRVTGCPSRWPAWSL